MPVYNVIRITSWRNTSPLSVYIIKFDNIPHILKVLQLTHLCYMKVTVEQRQQITPPLFLLKVNDRLKIIPSTRRWFYSPIQCRKVLQKNWDVNSTLSKAMEGDVCNFLNWSFTESISKTNHHEIEWLTRQFKSRKVTVPVAFKILF
jgi:hypothetical protein